MRKIIIVIGTIIFAVLMYSVPILLTCSFVWQMNGFLKLIFVVCAGFQFLMLVESILSKIKEEESEK